MKRFCFIFLTLSTALCAGPSYDEFKLNSDAVYRTGSGAGEGAATSLGASMIGWGIGLAIGIAVLAGVLHQSKGSHAH